MHSLNLFHYITRWLHTEWPQTILTYRHWRVFWLDDEDSHAASSTIAKRTPFHSTKTVYGDLFGAGQRLCPGYTERRQYRSSDLLQEINNFWTLITGDQLTSPEILIHRFEPSSIVVCMRNQMYIQHSRFPFITSLQCSPSGKKAQVMYKRCFGTTVSSLIFCGF